jgi:hypothetical protein
MGKKEITAMIVYTLIAALAFGLSLWNLSEYHALDNRIRGIENTSTWTLVADTVKRHESEIDTCSIAHPLFEEKKHKWENINTGEIRRVLCFAISFDSVRTVFILDNGDRWEKSSFFRQWRIFE